MTHPDPAYRQISNNGLTRFWIRFVAAKLSLFVGAVLIFILAAKLQTKGQLDSTGTYVMAVMCIASMVGVFTWNCWPRKPCPQCGMKMRGRNVRPKNRKGRAMILCCERCKLFIDLGVRGD